MRIVEFTRSFHLGGTEGQVVHLLKGLGERHEVHVAVLQETGPLIESVWALGYLPASFPLSASVARPTTAAQIARLALWLRRMRAEVLHAHDFYSAILAVPAARIAGCKVVLGRLDLAHWHGVARRAVLRELSKAADRVVANAEAVRRMLVEREGVSADRITLIPNGIDLKQFDLRRDKGPTGPVPAVSEEPWAVLVANMNPVKRHEDFLVAIAMLREQGRAIRAVVVGDGVRRSELEKLAQELGIAATTHFLGHRDDVPALLARARVGVLCSAAEGLPNAVIEGMAAGVPMVATAVGGVPELIREGESGLLVPPYRPQALSVAIARILDDPNGGREMGQRARAFVERFLSAERLVERHEQMYRQVCAT